MPVTQIHTCALTHVSMHVCIYALTHTHTHTHTHTQSIVPTQEIRKRVYLQDKNFWAISALLHVNTPKAAMFIAMFSMCSRDCGIDHFKVQQFCSIMSRGIAHPTLHWVSGYWGKETCQPSPLCTKQTTVELASHLFYLKRIKLEKKTYFIAVH